MNKHILFSLIVYAFFAFSLQYIVDLVRAIRFYEWKWQRDKLTPDQFKQRLEIDYYIANMQDLYNGK